MKRLCCFFSVWTLLLLCTTGCSPLWSATESLSDSDFDSVSNQLLLEDSQPDDTEAPPPEEPKIEEVAEVQELRPWYDYCTLIAHALGQVDGRLETNSSEAFFSSYRKGIRAFEADFQFTSDGVLVVRHDFDQMSYWNLEQTVDDTAIIMDSTRYVTEKIDYKYTPLTAADLLKLLVKYDDAYLITDSKEIDQDTVTAQFTALVEIAEDLGCPEVLDRVIVQIYNQEMLTYVRDVHPFQNWIFTLYMLDNPDLDEIGAFCVAEGIDVVTINSTVFTAEKGEILNGYGLKIYTHTLNRLSDINSTRINGAYGVYSDMITQSDMALIGMAAPYQQ